MIRNSLTSNGDRVSKLPTGTVTFLLTDIEGSTRLLAASGKNFSALLASTQLKLRTAVGRHAGVEVDCAGDGFFFAFASAKDAVAAAVHAQEALKGETAKVRMGLHTGHAERSKSGYVGMDVHCAARIAAVAHGGQILMSRSTRELVSCVAADLGEHRLKDLEDTVRIYQIGTDTFPPLLSLFRTNLPAAPTRFVGRRRELRALDRVVGRRNIRLITLIGPGGVGKTRLAIEAALRQIQHYPDGIWWIPLATLRDPSLVVESIARVVMVKGDLFEHLRGKRLLLVLDTFEHILGAASVISSMLEACSSIDVLITSRAPLEVASEWRYVVSPLSESDAIALLRTRANALGVRLLTSDHVRAICRRLDCLPLALELAAARTAILGPAALLRRLEQRLPLLSAKGADAPARHRTLRSTIEWSYDLLSSEEQHVFVNLAAFPDSWTLSAAEEIAGATLPLLESLVAKSLVMVADDRFSMLATIREYAEERLEGSARAENMRRGHRDCFLRWLQQQQADPASFGAGLGSALRLLESEHENLSAALRFSLTDPEDCGAALRFCALLRHHWQSRGHPREGLAACLDALAMPALETEERIRAAVLWTAGTLSLCVADFQQSSRLLLDARAVFRRLDDLRSEAAVLSTVGQLEYLRGDFGKARKAFNELLQVATGTQNAKARADALYGLGRVAVAEKQSTEARKCLEESLTLYREVGHRANEAIVLTQLGELALWDENYELAQQLLKEALAIGHIGHSAMVERVTIRRLGIAAAAQGQTQSARELLRDSLCASAAADDCYEIALGLRSIASLAFRIGAFRQGAILWGAADRATASIDALVTALVSDGDKARIADARNALTTELFDHAYQSGAHLPPSEALDAALRWLGDSSDLALSSH